MSQLNIRKADERGYADHGWLQTHHTFSFANYYDPDFMGFGHLRVINDDVVAPGKGFGTHPHRDMEIITWVLEGELEHRDSMGNGSIIRPGELQHMSAGTGVTHSEFNPSKDQPVHLLQIWILPDAPGHKPGYEQTLFEPEKLQGRLQLVASGAGRDGSISINQDADLHIGRFGANDEVAYEVAENRDVWVHIARGQLDLNEERLAAGDGVAVTQPTTLKFRDGEKAEVLLFDMARRTS